MPTLRNPKHEVFAQELAHGMSAHKAYVKAGFAEHRSNASVLARKPEIVSRVADLLAERESVHAVATAIAIDKTALTKEWIINRLRENVERAMQAVAVRDEEGNPVGEFKYDGSVANRALELLGKELGMFIDRSEINAIVRDVSSEPVSEEEWAETHTTAH